MNVLKSIAIAFGISVFYVALIVVGFYAFNGAGHGSELFSVALIAPISLVEDFGFEGLVSVGFVLWALVGRLLGFRRFKSSRIAVAAILILHYLGIVVLSFQTDWSHVGRVWDAFPGLVAAFVAIYLGSQGFLWMLITRKPQAGCFQS